MSLGHQEHLWRKLQGVHRTGSIPLLEKGAADLIGWEEGTAGINAAEWLAQAAPSAAVVYRTNSLVNQLVAARAGIGLAVLPCYLGDPEPGLARALPGGPVQALQRELWIVTRQDLRRTARVRAFFDAVAEGIRLDRMLIEGSASVRGK